MAIRPSWKVSPNYTIFRQNFEFTWNSGFALCQSRKNIHNLHDSIKKCYPNSRILEISSKSKQELGNQLSAHNLKLDGYYIENIYQSSKVFENGVQYPELLEVSPKKVKSILREKNVGKVIGFQYKDLSFSNNPITAFYDYIYIKAILISNIDLDEAITYDWFTDIIFNPNKSLNCQARAMAIYKALRLSNNLEVLESPTTWVEYHEKFVRC